MYPNRLFGILLCLLLFALFSCQTSRSINGQSGSWENIRISDDTEPVARHEAAFVDVKSKFYLLGGRRINPTNIYDPKSNTWRTGAEPPLELHHFQPVVFENEIYIMGALTGQYPGETPVPNIYIYNPETNTWRKGPEIPEGRRRGAAGVVVYQRKMYMACGIKDGHRGDHKKWLDVFDPVTGNWETLPDAPRPRDHFQATVANDRLYVIGGRTTAASEGPFKNTIGEVDVYDFEKGTWMTLPNHLPNLRAGNYNITMGNEILVLGGESEYQTPAHAEVDALNTLTNQWRSLSPMIQGRHGTGVIFYKGKLYVASGSGNRGGGPELTSMECMHFSN